MLRVCLGLVVLPVVGCERDPTRPPSQETASAPRATTTSTTASARESSGEGLPSAPFSTMSAPMTRVSDSLTASDAATHSSTEPVQNDAPDSGTTADGGQKEASHCDPRLLRCRRVEPTCDFGFVPRVVNGCYGECVAVDNCECDGPEACPQPELYTCNNSSQRCTPYLN